MARIELSSAFLLEARTLMTASPRVDLFAVPSLTSEPGRIVDGPDGDLWFLESDSIGVARIGRVTQRGQVGEFPLPTPAGGSSPYLTSLTAGPDGAAWAVDTANGQVDRVDPDGQVQSFTIPGTRGSATSSIVAGPDGNLWFSIERGDTSDRPGTIGRITPAGVVSTFSLPSGGGAAATLAAGPDGVWFLDPHASRIGTIDPAGHVVEFDVPTPSAGDDPNPDVGPDLAIGPDGDAYYFASPEFQSDLIKVTPDGEATPFALPDSTTSNLMAGPNGVYDLEEGADGFDELQRVGPDGTTDTVATIAASAFAIHPDLVIGPDGSPWFTKSPGLVGRIVLGATPVPVPGPALVVAPPPPVPLIDQVAIIPPRIESAGPVAPVGDPATLDLAGFRHSADVSIVSATIDWGDGSTPTAGTLGPDPYDVTNNGFDPFINGQVSGTHAYASAGSYTVTVTIQGTGLGGAAMTAVEVVTLTSVDPSPTILPTTALMAGAAIPFRGVLASFTTPTPHDVSGDDFTTTVDWGDGSTPSSGTVSGDLNELGVPGTPTLTGPSTAFDILGGHTYADTGNFTVRITLVDEDGRVATATVPIQVVPGRLAITPSSPLPAVVDPSPAQSGATEGLITLGTLSDFAKVPSDWSLTGTIDWGDGTAPTPATFGELEFGAVPEGSTDLISIQGTHAYAKAGSYTVSISVADDQGDSARATLVATASPGRSFIEAGPLIKATAGDSIASILGAVVAPVDDDTPWEFKATVDWGDGTESTPATVIGDEISTPPSSNRFDIDGVHTYATPGLYPLTITLVAPDGTSTSYVESAEVALDDAGEGSPARIPAFTEGIAVASVPVATFEPSSDDAAAAEFKATVDWGDGSPAQSATIQPSPQVGGFSSDFAVIAGHTYSSAGTFTVTSTVIGPDGLPAVITSLANVAAATVTAPPPAVEPRPIDPEPVEPQPTVGPPQPILTTPGPIPASPPATPTPTSSPTVPIARWHAWFVGPFSPAALSAQFATVAPTVATHPRPTTHPAKVKPAAHHPAVRTKATHPATKSAHHLAPKRHPAGPIKEAKRAR